MYLIKYALAHTIALVLNTEIEEIAKTTTRPPPLPPPTPIHRVQRARVERVRDLHIVRLSPAPEGMTPMLFFKDSHGNLIPLENLFENSDLEDSEDDDWVIGEYSE